MTQVSRPLVDPAASSYPNQSRNACRIDVLERFCAIRHWILFVNSGCSRTPGLSSYQRANGTVEIYSQFARFDRPPGGAAILVSVSLTRRPAGSAGASYGAFPQAGPLLSRDALPARCALHRTARLVWLLCHSDRRNTLRRRHHASGRAGMPSPTSSATSRTRCGGPSLRSAPSAMAMLFP